MLFGKDNEKQLILSMVKSGSVPHGLLLSGEKGIGKRVFSKWCAKLFLCENPTENGPCDECLSCTKQKSGNHPDIVYIECEKLRIDELREIMTTFSYYPQDGELRVIIFENSEGLTPILQNYLLKAIEEPSPHNRYIFTCNDVRQLLSTIISRLVHIRMQRPSEDDCIRCLCHCGMDNDKAEEMVKSYGANPGYILQLVNDEEKISLYKTVSDMAYAIANYNEYEVVRILNGIKGRDNIVFIIRELYSCCAKSLTEDSELSCVNYMKDKMTQRHRFDLAKVLGELSALDGVNFNENIFKVRISTAIFDVLN